MLSIREEGIIKSCCVFALFLGRVRQSRGCVVQLDSLELKLAESRRQNHDRRTALQQVEKTIESDATLVQARLQEERRLQQQLEISWNGASQFQRSLSFDSETRAKSK